MLFPNRYNTKYDTDVFPQYRFRCCDIIESNGKSHDLTDEKIGLFSTVNVMQCSVFHRSTNKTVKNLKPD